MLGGQMVFDQKTWNLSALELESSSAIQLLVNSFVWVSIQKCLNLKNSYDSDRVVPLTIKN